MPLSENSCSLIDILHMRGAIHYTLPSQYNSGEITHGKMSQIQDLNRGQLPLVSVS